MRTAEEALAVGEEFRRLLLLKLISDEGLLQKLQIPVMRKNTETSVVESLDLVNNKIKPYLNVDNLGLYEGRGQRSFERELNRLWEKAVECYELQQRNSLDPEFKAFLDQSKDQTHQNFLDLLASELQNHVFPFLEQHETLGDDFYLLITQYLQIAEEGAVEKIAITKSTPPELPASVFGMFGLLMQARRYYAKGEADQAYSCLLDAGNLIGMHDGARYTMKHLPAVAAKLRAKANGEKSRANKAKEKVRAAEIFYTLRPMDGDGRQTAWESADEALKRIWKELVNEALADGRDEPYIADSTVRTLCRKLHNSYKQGVSYEIRVEVIQCDVSCEADAPLPG